MASGAGAALDVVVTNEGHGVYYAISTAGAALGKITVPINTLVMQTGPGEASAELKAAMPRVEAMLDFTKRDPRRIPRLATREEILAALTGRHDLTPIEVTQENVDELRHVFVSDLGPGHIVWRISGSKLFGVIYSRIGQGGPIRALIGTFGPPQQPTHVGDAVLVGEDEPYLQNKAGAVVRLITGMP